MISKNLFQPCILWCYAIQGKDRPWHRNTSHGLVLKHGVKCLHFDHTLGSKQSLWTTGMKKAPLLKAKDQCRAWYASFLLQSALNLSWGFEHLNEGVWFRNIDSDSPDVNNFPSSDKDFLHNLWEILQSFYIPIPYTECEDTACFTSNRCFNFLCRKYEWINKSRLTSYFLYLSCLQT